MTRKPRITIETDGVKSNVLVDGEKLNGVVGIQFTQNCRESGGLPKLQIDLNAMNVTLDSQILPGLPEPFRKFYIPIELLISDERIPKAAVEDLCKSCGIDLNAF